MENNIEKKIMEYFYKSGKKLTRDEVRKKIGISGEDELAFFDTTLSDLEAQGDLYLDKKGYYHIFDDSLVVVQGKIYISHKGDGYVRVISDDERTVTTNFMIRNEDLNGALPNDIVTIYDLGKNNYGHQFGVVEKVVKRDPFKEVYEYVGNNLLRLYGFNQEMYVQLHNGDARNLVKGSLVLAEPQREGQLNAEGKLVFEGTITNNVGHIDDPTTQIRAVGLQFGFDNKFSNKINRIADSLPTVVTEEEIGDRVDLRKEKIFTIDGADTKDIDDAISISKDGDNYILKVHIADVSHYVKPYKELVEQAVMRGNSAYLADSVFPMFPHKLSNGICSLNEDSDRLTKTVEMVIDSNGNIVDSSIYKSIIRSQKQMRYDKVNQIFNNKQTPEGYEEFVSNLNLMKKLSNILTGERKSRGSLELGGGELKIHTDIEGKPISLKIMRQDTAERLIENFMIVANRTVTEHYGYLGLPFIYRIHEAPDADKILKVATVLKEQQIISDKIASALIAKATWATNTDNGTIAVNDLIPLLNAVKDTDYYEPVSNLLLRSLKKAKYTPTNLHHFGLSEEDYSHFTSPIRRAADLLNHIIIDYSMELNMCTDDKRRLEIETILNEMQNNLLAICEHISAQEVNSDEAERWVEDILQVQYVLDNIDYFDDVLEAKITNVNKLGLRIMVDDLIKADIDTADLEKEGYSYKRESRTFVNSKKDVLGLGSKIWVSNVNPSLETRTVNYQNMSLQKDDLSVNPFEGKKLIKSQKVVF